jgi:hypothetical protein
MKDNIAPRGFRATLLVFSGALLLGLAACSNTYGPPLAGQSSLTWGQQHYLDNQRAQADHDSRRSDRSDHQGSGFHGQP